MIIIIEGADALGKSTQIQLIKNEYEKNGVACHILHYSNLKFSKDFKEVEKMSKRLYASLFKLLETHEFSNSSDVIILDRSHIGEYIYAPLYRNYSGDYVFELENDFIKNYKYASDNTRLILFTDDVNKIIKRDIQRGDNKSFSLDPEIKKKEIKAFEEAFNKSNLTKKIIHLNNRTPEEIFFQEVKPFLYFN